MNAVDFPEATFVLAKDQPPYNPLPAHFGVGGRMTFCWQLTWRERMSVIFTGRVWHQVLTFGHPLQPQKLMVERPEMR